MATVTGLTAARMQEIEEASVVGGTITGGHLILETQGGDTIDAGSVVGPAGPTGPTGPAGISAIPGEVRMWPGGTLPAIGTYGRWVWADGAVYAVASHPIAAGHINAAWKTAHGQSDPGAGNFRVPDLRGLTPAGLDAMPGGTRANRMTRAVAITLAAKTGEETHVITLPEVPGHNHGGSVSISGSTSGVGDHTHPFSVIQANAYSMLEGQQSLRNIATQLISNLTTGGGGAHSHSFSGSGSIPSAGGGGAHENVQPTVFVPYIVFLDG